MEKQLKYLESFYFSALKESFNVIVNDHIEKSKNELNTKLLNEFQKVLKTIEHRYQIYQDDKVIKIGLKEDLEKELKREKDYEIIIEEQNKEISRLSNLLNLKNTKY